MKSKTYCTTYCNHAHRVRDGVPVGHECYQLPAKALEYEMAGNYDQAIEVIKLAKHTGNGLRMMRGA